MVKLAQVALLAAPLAAGLLGATVPVAAETGQMSPADNEASAMGNCFDRRLGVSRSAMDGPVGSHRPMSNADTGRSGPSSTAPPSGNVGASDANAAPGTTANSTSPSSLPDCK